MFSTVFVTVSCLFILFLLLHGQVSPSLLRLSGLNFSVVVMCHYIKLNKKLQRMHWVVLPFGVTWSIPFMALTFVFFNDLLIV